MGLEYSVAPETMALSDEITGKSPPNILSWPCPLEELPPPSAITQSDPETVVDHDDEVAVYIVSCYRPAEHSAISGTGGVLMLSLSGLTSHFGMEAYGLPDLSWKKLKKLAGSMLPAYRISLVGLRLTCFFAIDRLVESLVRQARQAVGRPLTPEEKAEFFRLVAAWSRSLASCGGISQQGHEELSSNFISPISEFAAKEDCAFGLRFLEHLQEDSSVDAMAAIWATVSEFLRNLGDRLEQCAAQIVSAQAGIGSDPTSLVRVGE
ncbi:hypothetical protein DSUL_20363 [Desulfovibrionales bacterium]